MMYEEPPANESQIEKLKRLVKERPWVIALCVLIAVAFVVMDEMGTGSGNAPFQMPAQQMQSPQNPQSQFNPQSVLPPPAVDTSGQIAMDMSPVDLPIENLRQETQVWCWAAVSQQIIAASRGMQNTPPQCALVAIANGAAPEFCCQMQNPQCVTTGSLQQITGLIQHFGGRTSSYAPPTDAMTLYNTLRKGHAVIIGVDIGQGMGHVVVARGMSFEQTPQGVVPLVHINDPMAHFTQPVPFNQIAAVWKQAIIVN